MSTSCEGNPRADADADSQRRPIASNSKAASAADEKSKTRKAKSELAAEEAEASAAKTAMKAARAAGASAEELNAKGNDAFKAGRNAEAEVWYGAAMKADPRAAKYPSNRFVDLRPICITIYDRASRIKGCGSLEAAQTH
eukprot:tig00020563_g11322.t1